MSNPTAQGKEQGNTMEKHILVALPLSEAQRDIIRQAAPQFAYRFTTEDHTCEGEIKLVSISDETFLDNGHAIAWAMQQ